MQIDTYPYFSAMFAQENKFRDFLFASKDKNKHSKEFIPRGQNLPI